MHRAEHLHGVVAKVRTDVKRRFLELPKLRGRNKQKLSQYLFSFMEKHLIVFLFTKFKSKKQTLMTCRKK